MLYPEYHTPPPYGHPLYLRGGVFRPVLLRATPILPLSKGEYPEGGREYVGESGSMLRGGVFRPVLLRATPILPLSKGEYPEGGREYVGESGSMLRGGVFREFFLLHQRKI